MPGVDGSLGQCALCGDTFLKEILLGRNVTPFEIDGCDQTLYAHKECIKKYEGKDFPSLPESSPLRQAFESQKSK